MFCVTIGSFLNPGGMTYIPLCDDNRFMVCICHVAGIEDDPKATLDIQCLRRGGRPALITTNNNFLNQEVVAVHGL